ncbi:uncharacterized protein LOC127257130 isoform X2 [Andrographis paniculata]|nr:uncharacterized protein LOC127257130 isoform X2 [Andrographis paniculata]
MLSYLQQRGFSNTQMEKMVKVWPELLLARFDNSIEPKIKVFQYMGFSSKDITVMISANPSILKINLNSRIIPLLSLLKGSFGNNEAVAKFMSRMGGCVSSDLKRTMLPNIELLKCYGVPMERIIKLMYTFPRCMMLNLKIFKKAVEKAEEMGADRKSQMFIYTVQSVSQMSGKTMELKLQAFRNFGFSESDILATVQKAPSLFSSSVDRLKRTIEFLLATGKYDMSCIGKYPTALSYSLEQRYKPRCKVLQVLESRNLIEKWPSLSMLSLMSDEKFFEKFVGPYLSELNNVYPIESSVGSVEEETKVSLSN